MRILIHDQLHRHAPAIFAHQPDEAVSDRYGFVPTINVVDALQREGWYPVRAQQTHVRQAQRREVARHMIRFRQDPDRQIAVGDSVTELVLTNAMTARRLINSISAFSGWCASTAWSRRWATWAAFACVTDARSSTRSSRARST